MKRDLFPFVQVDFHRIIANANTSNKRMIFKNISNDVIYAIACLSSSLTSLSQIKRCVYRAKANLNQPSERVGL